MPRTSFFTFIIAIALFSVSNLFAQEESLNAVMTRGLIGGDTVAAGEQIRWEFILTHDGEGDCDIRSFSHGFEVYTAKSLAYPDSAGFFDVSILDTLPISWSSFFDGGVFIGGTSMDGKQADTMRTAGFCIFKSGFVSGTVKAAYSITTRAYQPGDTICVDSCWYPPAGAWLWGQNAPCGSLAPATNLELCYFVDECCKGDQGNVDRQFGTNVADLTILVNYVFPPHDSLLCGGVGNVDGITIAGSPINVADITYLVAYLFQGGPPPAECE